MPTETIRTSDETAPHALDIQTILTTYEAALNEWAWARTSSAGRTRILSTGAEVTEGNNELFVFRREKGAWKIHRDLCATSQPPRA